MQFLDGRSSALHRVLAFPVAEVAFKGTERSDDDWHNPGPGVPHSLYLNLQITVLADFLSLFREYVRVIWDCDIDQEAGLLLSVVDNYVWSICCHCTVCVDGHIPHDGRVFDICYLLWVMIVPAFRDLSTEILKDGPVQIACHLVMPVQVLYRCKDSAASYDVG